MIDRKQGHIRRDVLAPFIAGLELIAPKTKVELSRDPDEKTYVKTSLARSKKKGGFKKIWRHT